MGKKKHAVLKADFADLFDSLSDDGQSILQGHLVIENMIVRLLTTGLKHPEHVNIDSIRFGQRVELCIALGILVPESKPAYIHLNELRNRVAHTLGIVINKNDVATWLSKFSPEQLALMTGPNTSNLRLVIESYTVSEIITECIGCLCHEASSLLDERGVSLQLLTKENRQVLLSKAQLLNAELFDDLLRYRLHCEH